MTTKTLRCTTKINVPKFLKSSETWNLNPRRLVLCQTIISCKVREIPEFRMTIYEFMNVTTVWLEYPWCFIQFRNISLFTQSFTDDKYLHG